MTLAEFQPYVEAAVTAFEWEVARARRAVALDNEQAAIEKALTQAGDYGVEPEPLEARLAQIGRERRLDITPDLVPQLPLRSVPMDLITAAVVRHLLKLPAEFPVLSIKALPDSRAILEAVSWIAMRWQTPNGQSGADEHPAAQEFTGPWDTYRDVYLKHATHV